MSSNSLYAVLGDDDYLVRQRAKEIFDELCPEFPDDLSREILTEGLIESMRWKEF